MTTTTTTTTRLFARRLGLTFTIAGLLLLIGCGADSAERPQQVTVTASGDEAGWWSVIAINADGASAALPPSAPAPLQPERLRLGTDLLFFATDSSHIGPDGTTALANAAALLTGRPDSTPIAVVGHTDATGSPEHNQQLGVDRATAVITELRRLGVPAAQILPPETRGELCPLAPNTTATGRSHNRRVEILLDTNADRCPAPTA